MKRKQWDQLIRWKLSPDRKLLIVRGARFTGKTWLLKEFGRIKYRQCVYLNFKSTPRLRGLFTKNADIPWIIMAIQIEAGFTVNAPDTLIIFDDIQEAPDALMSLKYFREKAPEYHVIAAGSLPEAVTRDITSFPADEVEVMNLYPLTFPEFLHAVDEPLLCRVLENFDWSGIKDYHFRYIELLKQYCYVGGMPEAVLSFSEQRDLKFVRRIQKRILTAYEESFPAHTPVHTKLVWDSILSQLAKKNRKFAYRLIKKGSRAKDYAGALAWLINSGIVCKVNDMSSLNYPAAFKLLLLDVGLLGAMGELDVINRPEGNIVFTEFNGALTEQYVFQQLIAQEWTGVDYWSPRNIRSEIDFLLQTEGYIVPVEVQNGDENRRSKRLAAFCGKYMPEDAIRVSLTGFRDEEWMTNIPLYTISGLDTLLKY